MFEIIFTIVIVGYFIQTVIFLIGANKKFEKYPHQDLLTVSIIVAARNEEKNILKTITSLDNLDYPKENLEIILVDDQSIDATGQIMDNFIKNKTYFRKISTENFNSKLIGKMRALDYGIKEAKNEIIITTDADCEVKPQWVKTITSYYNNDIALVAGLTNQVADNWFGGIQAIDFIHLLSVAAGTSNLGKPISCIGNNMSYRKSVYFEVGGYDSLPFSVTEDFTIMNAIYRLRKYKIVFPLDKDMLVTSLPCDNFSTLYHQKKRWGIGGFQVPLRGFIIMFWGFFANLFVLLTPFLFSTIWLYLVTFKIAIDFFYIYSVHKKLDITKNLKYFFHHQIYYLIYVVLLPFIVLVNQKVVWKGRTY